jgi:hypothetical protein
LPDGILRLKSVIAQAVDNFALTFGPFSVLKDGIATRRFRVRCLFLLLLVGLFGGRALAAGDFPNAAATSVAPGPQFAIADFDGDLRPDFVSIQGGTNVSGGADYWIQLQLTSVGRQSIQLVAPAGGLQIEARDVNGDHAIDLVVTTTWSREPVAIFLNDGRGSFSRVETTAFPGAFSEPKSNWGFGSNSVTDTAGVLSQSGAGAFAEEQDSLRDRSPARLIPPSSAGFPVSSSSFSYPDRAPPSAIRYL